MSEPESINEKLGALLADRVRAAEDRATTNAKIDNGFASVHRRIDQVVALPELFAAHEKQDADRHDQNTERLDSIEERLGSIETTQNRAAGARAALSAFIGFLLTALGLVAGYLRWGR